MLLGFCSFPAFDEGVADDDEIRECEEGRTLLDGLEGVGSGVAECLLGRSDAVLGEGPSSGMGILLMCMVRVVRGL